MPTPTRRASVLRNRPGQNIQIVPVLPVLVGTSAAPESPERMLRSEPVRLNGTDVAALDMFGSRRSRVAQYPHDALEP